MRRMSRLLVVVTLCGVALTAPASARPNGTGQTASLRTLRSTSAHTFGLFHWRALRRVDHYQFELASDRHFKSLVLGGSGALLTRNTWVTLPKVVANGKYWWRIRGVTAGGRVTRWFSSTATKHWTATPQLLSPANGAAVAFPTDPLLLSWSSVSGAVRYQVSIATDPKLGSLVGGNAVTTSATAYVPPVTLQQGVTYYWAVTPLDAEGHEGVQSAVRSFTWGWNSSITPSLQDLVAAPEFFNPLLAWTKVPGAADYEINVNFDQSFAPGSMVCCSQPTTATGYTPTQLLPNNTYYWRVRAVNVRGGDGTWTATQSFTQTFDNVPPVVGSSISNLHVRDNLSDAGPEPPGWSTSSPILVWNAVPGASSYNVEVVPWTGAVCDWTASSQHWTLQTAVTAWTPLGNGHVTPPYPPSNVSVANDGPVMIPGAYCARVRAVADTGTDGHRVYGDFTYLPDAFTYTPVAASGAAAIPTSGDYLSPVFGQTPTSPVTPLITWKPIVGANSYWVIVARDPSFTTLVDYAFTRIPAYAPRRGNSPQTYADETTHYYWAVLPASGADGSGVSVADPTLANAAAFDKQSITPALYQVNATTQPQFRWTPATGARSYRLQVSTDSHFGTQLLDNVVTDSTGYTSNTVYPAQTTLYWRVQANDENDIPLTWSNVGTFKQTLVAPIPISGQLQSDAIQPLRWKPVDGAIGYDIRVKLPDGGSQTFSNIETPASVPLVLTGAGFFSWQVRAEFPHGVAGPYSTSVAFTRTVTPPGGERATVHGRSLLLRWKGRPGIKSYRVEISRRPDFSQIVDAETTESPMLAPSLYQAFYQGRKFFWHVAAVDADGNTGSFSATKKFRFRGPRGK